MSRFGRVLRLQPPDIGSNLGVTPIALEKFTDPGTGISEQRLVDELDGGSRALDVQQDCADLAQVDAVRSGM
jgi:hypothetical protein